MVCHQHVTTYALLYRYDDRTDEREALRPAHRAYLSGLTEPSVAVAFARWADDGDPGALIVISAPSREDALAVPAADPYVTSGLVSSYELREWPAVGPWPSA